MQLRTCFPVHIYHSARVHTHTKNTSEINQEYFSNSQKSGKTYVHILHNASARANVIFKRSVKSRIPTDSDCSSTLFMAIACVVCGENVHKHTYYSTLHIRFRIFEHTSQPAKEPQPLWRYLGWYLYHVICKFYGRLCYAAAAAQAHTTSLMRGHLSSAMRCVCVYGARKCICIIVWVCVYLRAKAANAPAHV